MDESADLATRGLTLMTAMDRALEHELEPLSIVNTKQEAEATI